MRFVALVALLLAIPVTAQVSAQVTGRVTGPSPPLSEIVVTANPHREEQVRNFVKALTPARGGSIPRFIDAVCPGATGLGPAQKEAVIARFRTVATAAGIRVGKAGCVPNMFIIVTADKNAFIELLAKKRPGSFGAMSGREIARLARTPGPAAAWQLEGPVNASGVPLRFDEATGAYVNSTTEAASSITVSAGRGFDAAALIVEVKALDGIRPVQLADYAAMRLLAKLDPARLPQRGPTTILTVLTTPMGSPIPITMSKWDLGFLRGLYAATSNLSPASQRSQIAGQVLRDLGGTSPKRNR